MKLNEIKQLNESQFLTDHDEIASWLEKYEICDYVILSNNEVDVNEPVHLINKRLTQIPIKFNHVDGYFDIDNNFLTSLEGSPKTCNGYFSCQNNKLTSINFAPKFIEQTGYFNGNQITALIGINDIFERLGFVGADGGLSFDYDNIIQGGLGLVLIDGLTYLHDIADYDGGPFNIIKKYLGKPDDIFDCQNELIEAGFEEFAKL